MKKIINNFTKILLLVVITVTNFIIPINVLSLTETEVKDTASKGDIYNPLENSVGDEVTITDYNYANNSSYENGDVEVQKIVSKTDILGKYKVEFKIRGKNVIEGITTINPVYVVVVLDQSNSMAYNNKWTNAIKGAKEFAVSLLNSIPSAQIALVEFSGKPGNINYSDAKVIRHFENNNFNNTDFGNYGENGGATNIGEGLRYAYNLLNSSSISSNAYKYVVVLSDGEPTVYTDDKGVSKGFGSMYDKKAHEYANTWANNLKKTSTNIFSIGYGINDNSISEKVLKEIASKSSYYTKANTNNIVSKFKQVVNSFEVEYNAGYDVTITDSLGSSFTLTSGSTTLNIDKITDTWTSLGSFYINIDESSPNGWYSTNEGFKVTYKDYKGNLKEIICNDNPEVYWKQSKYNYKVNYYFNNELDNTFTKNGKEYLNTFVYAKDNYLSSQLLKNKNTKDNTTYFIDPNNSSNTSNIKINSDVNKNVLNIYYIDTNFTNESIDKFTSVNIIESSNTTIPYTIEYNVDVNNVISGDKVTTVITDTLPYEIEKSKSNLNGGVYNKENKTITWTLEEDINSYKVTHNVYKKIEYSVVYKDFSNISSSADNFLINNVKGYTKLNNKETKGVSDKEDVEVKIKGYVTTIYVEEEKESKLSNDTNLSGLVGENYSTTPKDILGYTLVEEKYPQNNEGKYIEGDITVKYVYKKNSGEVIHDVVKEGLESVSSTNDKFDYKIIVNSTILDYVGNVKLKVIDTLPYKLDKKSVIDNRCKYDGNLEIMCEIDYGKIKGEDYIVNELGEKTFNINEEFNFELYFINVDSETITNNVSSEIILDNTSNKKIDNTKTSIPTGNVIVNYVTKDGKKLHDTVTITGLCGTNYQTIKKEFDKYSFIEVEGDVKGNIKEGTTNITYIYDTTPLPPQTGVNSFTSLKYILLFILTLGLIPLAKKVYSKVNRK